VSNLLPMHVYDRPDERFSYVKGPIKPLLAGTSIRAIWNLRVRAYEVRSDRLAELLVLAELAGNYHVRMHPGGGL
jgi:hypothetical protein